MPDELLRMSAVCTSDNILQDITFHIYAGETIAIFGPSNSGKHKLSQILTGEIRPLSGDIYFKGSKLPCDPQALFHAGIFVSGYCQLIESMSALDNICAILRSRHGFFYRTGKYEEKILMLQKELDVFFNLHCPVGMLSPFEQWVVELIKSILSGAQLIVVNHSHFFSSEREKNRCFHILRKLQNRGIALIIMINSAYSLPPHTDRAYVLHHGRITIQLDSIDAQAQEHLQTMLGPTHAPAFSAEPLRKQEPLLEIKNLSSGSMLDKLNLTIYRGECVGISDPTGSGRILAHVLGGNAPYAGEILLEGRTVKLHSIAQAQALRIVLVHEGIYDNGFIDSLNLEDNLTLPCYRSISRFSFLNPRKKAYLAAKGQHLMEPFWAPDGTEALPNPVIFFICRMLLLNPKLLILVYPFQFLDDTNRQAVQNIVNRLKHGNTAILVVSSDTEYLTPIADRVFRSSKDSITPI